MSEEEAQGAPEQDSIMAEASMWFGRMRGPEAEAHRPEFEAWLARGALHRAFYNRAGEVYAMGKFLKEEAEGKREPDDPHSDIGARHEREQVARSRRWIVGGVLAAVCLLVAAIAAALPTYLRQHVPGPEIVSRTKTPASSFRLDTPEGQVLTQTLPDGSRVTLDPGSSLLIAYNATSRALYLERGKSRFEVAHEARPFVVHAGSGSVTARGTIFEVTLLASRQVAVHLVRGSVDVALETSKPGPDSVRRLRAGEMIVLSETTIGVPTLAPATGTDGTPGVVVAAPEATSPEKMEEFTEAPLRDVLASSNKRGAIQIQLAQPALGDLKVSGRFHLDDSAALARKLALIFGLDIEQPTPGTIVLKRP